MKITVQFDSLEEFQEHFTVGNSADSAQKIISQLEDAINDSTEIISSAVDKVYHAGRDDVGGKLHKDIKDIDDVADDYDEALYLKVKADFDYLFETYPQRHVTIKSWIKREVGDYEVRPGLSVNAYQQLERNAAMVKNMLE